MAPASAGVGNASGSQCARSVGSIQESGYRPLVRAIRRFTVRPVLPPALSALSDLAGNLRWSWHPETQDVFEAVDPELWEATGRDPVKLLGAVGRARLEELAADESFLEMLGAARADLEAYLTGDRWFQRRQAAGGAPRRSRTSPRSSASPRCCRSTPAASASSPVTTSRPRATSASRSSAWACSTATATSGSRCPARAGSRRPTRSSTPTGCRSRCSARPTARAPRSPSRCPVGPT